jgi:citrate lyase subunit beta/citryl-CoA lyase
MGAARSYLYVPGHREELVAGAFDRGADVVVLDLEDGVPEADKDRARALVAKAVVGREAIVRVNRAGTALCAADLAAVAGVAAGLRLPKVESAGDVAWARDRAPGVPLDCTIESALGVLRVLEIATAPGVTHLSFGAADLATDLGVADNVVPLFHARSQVVLASRAAGLGGPSDGVYAQLADLEGLRRAATHARRLGFEAKSAIHPSQVAVINEIFRPTPAEVEWARRVVAAFDAASGNPLRLDDGEFVDLPIAERARRVLERA